MKLSPEQLIKVLELFTFHVTGKTVVAYEGPGFYQTKEKIGVNPTPGDYLILLHEIGHYLAATPREQELHNLGLPEELDQHGFEREVEAREISKLIFLDWARAFLNDAYLIYAEYLMSDIFAGHYYNEYQEPDLSQARLEEKIQQSGHTLHELKETLFYYTHSIILPW